MNREAFYYNEGSISIDNILSPMQNQFMNHTINSSQKGRSNFECQDTSYSPFVVKRNSNIFNSNSSSKSIYNEKSAHNLKVYTPSPNNLKNERLSDRFIPMNKRVNLLEKFELARHCDTNRTLFNDNQQDESEVNETTNQNNKTYSSLLEDNFFNCKDKDTLRGETNDMFSNQKNSNILIKSKILSFRTETKRKSSGLTSLGNMFDNNTIDSATRKISNRPYKIIEAPGLLDDFYLNLLDWSSLNDIAVGLGNSVVLWCANKTQEVKLLSYTGNKYVTSVMWSAAGTELAVGNSEGTIEIWDSKHSR